MRHAARVGTGIAIAALLVALALPAEALVDDFEADFWLPFTHLNLGDRASAGYAEGVARSGSRSYRVAIHGWSVRDWGSAFGYAVFATHGASLSRIRLSVLPTSLSDASPSVWDAYAVGVGLQLLDGGYRAVGEHRYVVAYRPSANAGRCGPTTADVVLDRAPPAGAWIDIGRDPSADFPAARWAHASFVRVSIGLLCAAGLTGAAYEAYFDDFALDTDAGDRDADGIDDLEEDTRRFITDIATTAPLRIPSGESATVRIDGPRVSGEDLVGALRVEIDHPRPEDLSIVLETSDGSERRAGPVWDPGAHARGIAIVEPAQGAAVRGTVRVAGRASVLLAGDAIDIVVDGHRAATVPRDAEGDFVWSLETDAIAEGRHSVRAEFLPLAGSGETGIVGHAVPFVVDRTAPDLAFDAPAPGAVLSGLIRASARATDATGVAAVELWVDGARVDVRREEPFAFVYDTLDLANGAHRLEVRARDHAGNEAARSADVTVDNTVLPVLLPCLPVCNFASGSSTGDLPPPPALAVPRRSTLMGGLVVRTFEALRAPWRPGVTWTDAGAVLVLDLLRDPASPEADGVVSPGIANLAAIVAWRIVIRDHGSGGEGRVGVLSLILASRTSSAAADTDGDGLDDLAERLRSDTSPVLADGDHDGLSDGLEVTQYDVEIVVDGRSQIRRIASSPADADSDDDGVSDGEELRPSEGGPITDPADPDTDADALSDGVERLVHGSDPTLSDTDGDGLDDGYEVRPRTFTLLVNDTLTTWALETSPVLPDTDDDGVSDPDEEFGRNAAGVATHPALPDTDGDGLSDYEELNVGVDGLATEALHIDPDRDGVWDTFDKLPMHAAEVDWRTEYPAGLIRFDQLVHVFWLEGKHAEVWKRVLDLATGELICEFAVDDVGGSTKSSVVTPDGIVNETNRIFVEAGETRYRAQRTVATVPGLHAFSVFRETVSGCPENASQYDFEYWIHQDSYLTSFVNVEATTIEDDAGRPYAYAFVPLPVDIGASTSVILQFSLAADADRSHFESYASWLAPAFTYVVFASPDFANSSILHGGTAFATELNEFAYRVELRIPGTALAAGSVGELDGVPTIGLFFGPSWIGRANGRPVREAMDPNEMAIASITTERPTQVYSLAVRLNRDDQDALEAHADELAQRPTGYYVVGSAVVYVFHRKDGSAFDGTSVETADGILIVAESESDLFAARDDIQWGSPGVWYQEVQDPWGQAVKAFRDSLKIVRVAVVVAQFVELLRFRYADPGSYVIHADQDSLILLEKNELDGDVLYVISRAESEQHLVIDVIGTGEVVVRKEAIYRVTTSEVTTDLTTSKLLGNRYLAVKSVLRGLGVGAILATNGRDAVIAFQQGDAVRGLVYGTNAALGVIGVLKGDTALASLVGLRSEKFRALRLGTLTTLAAGALLAGFELHLGASAPDSLTQRRHYEKSASHMIDTTVSIVPVYGSAFLLTWGTTSLLISLILPDPLAARITSSPGTAVVFLFEYFLTGTIPSPVAESVLSNALEAMLLLANANVVLQGIPSIPLMP